MKLHYIYHSGYVIEADNYAILIDYYKDTEEAAGYGYVHDQLLRRPGRLYILSSHFHPDHFNPEILSWRSIKPDIVYIFSKDILRHRKNLVRDLEGIIYLRKGETYEDENLSVKAFGSTDIGVSFLLNTGGKQIFHAGDLNNWHWKDESTAEEVRKAEGDYLAELKLLSDAVDRLDLAMFPVDSRMGSDYARGAEQFIDSIPTTLFAPMHFEDTYEAQTSFKQYAEGKGVQFMHLKEKGQSIEF